MLGPNPAMNESNGTADETLGWGRAGAMRYIQVALGKRDRLRVTSSSKHEICCVACTSGSHGHRLSCLRTKANEVKAHLVLGDNELSEHSATARGPLDQRTRDKFTESTEPSAGTDRGWSQY